MPKTDVDVSSAEPVLFYTGPGIVRDAPADDLSGNALARLAWLRAKKRPATPADIDQAALAALRDELVATGNYATSRPATPAEGKS